MLIVLTKLSPIHCLLSVILVTFCIFIYFMRSSLSSCSHLCIILNHKLTRYCVVLCHDIITVCQCLCLCLFLLLFLFKVKINCMWIHVKMLMVRDINSYHSGNKVVIQRVVVFIYTRFLVWDSFIRQDWQFL